MKTSCRFGVLTRRAQGPIRFLTGSLLPLCVVMIVITGLPGKEASAEIAVPHDFEVRLESAARGPQQTPPDVAWVQINAGGEAEVSEMRGRDGRLPATSIKLPPDALARIYQVIVDQRFFDLRPLYEDPAIRDGDQAEITVTADGRTHTVRTVNIAVNAFDRITIAIDRELPIERRIQYNALREESYKSIER